MKTSKKILLALCCLATAFFVGCKQPAQEEEKGGLEIEDLGPGNTVVIGPSEEENESTELTALDAPTALYFDGETGILSWNNNVAAVNGWNVKITSGEKSILDTVAMTSQIDLSELPVGEYRAELKTQGVENTFLESSTVVYAFSVTEQTGESVITDKMPQPKQFAFDSEKELLIWEDVEGNNGYLLSVYSGETLVYECDTTTVNVSTLDLPLGDYTAKLTVSGDGVTVNDSDEKTLAFSITSFGDLTVPSGLQLDNGSIVWDKKMHTSGVDIVLKDYATKDRVNANFVVENGNRLSIAELGVPSGTYTVRVAWKSNRHDQEKSGYAEYDFSLEYAKSYTPSEIVGFDGELPRGEHGGAKLVTENGKQYAAIYPTKDGWGRLGSSEFTLDFDRNPVVFISVGRVQGGYHLQIKQNDSYYLIVPDTNKLGNTSADIVAKTGVSGKHSVYLRLGVNGSTSGTNDALVYYSGIQVFYVNEFNPEQVPEVEDLKLNTRGEVVWEKPDNANSFGVTIKEYGTETIVYESEQTQTAYGVYDLQDGVYTVTVRAKNNAFGEEYSSIGQSIDVKVSGVARYSAADLDTSSGSFVSMGEQGIEAKYDAEKGYTIFNSTEKTDWGYIGPKNGVQINMDKNPLIVIKTQGVQGGYFAKQEFSGSSVVDVQNNTSLDYSGDGVHIIRANVSASNQEKGEKTWSGVKEDYKFYMGSLGKADGEYKKVCRIYLTGIDIVYVEEYEELSVPSVPTKLSAPTNFKTEGTAISSGTVEGNSAYTPTYELSLKGDGVDYKATALSPELDLKSFNLKENSAYTFTVKAIGDNLYFADSDAVSVTVNYAVRSQVDLSAIEISRREGNGSVVTQETGKLVYKATSGEWVLFALAIQTGAVSQKDVLIVDFGEVTDGTLLAGRYYTSDKGANHTYNLGGDTPISSNMTRVYSMSNAKVVDGTFYLGLGMGGGNGDRTIEVKSIRIVAFEITEEK